LSEPVPNWLLIVPGKPGCPMDSLTAYAFPHQPSPPSQQPPSQVPTDQKGTTQRFVTQTPIPSLWSQSFSLSYGSILPTSLEYILLLTIGCSPWGPDADMGTVCEECRTMTGFFWANETYRTPQKLECPSAAPSISQSETNSMELAAIGGDENSTR